MNDSIWYSRISDNLEYYSYGCPDSRWDLETIIYQLDMSSITKPTILIDTCCGIDLQENISKMLVKNLADIYPEKQLIIIGCGVNYDRNFFSKYGKVLNNQEKFDMTNYPFKSVKKDIFLAPHVYGAVKIQDGCYQECTYCTICKVRSHFTFTYEEIDKQIRTCINNGWCDILLFGTDICYYHKDGHDLLDLCNHVLKTFPEITSLKLDSINPGYNRIYELIDLIKNEPRFQKDLDLAIQSCSNTILKSVGRTYTYEDIKKITEHAGNDLFIAHQLITGLPGESEELFKESFDNIKKLGPQLITLCPYSKRKGTKAIENPDQVPHDIAKKRELLLRKTFNTAEYSSQIEFNKYRPKSFDTRNNYVISADLYDQKDFKNVFLSCEKCTNKPIIIRTTYSEDKDWYYFEVTAKMLMVTFGAKIVTSIYITDSILENINIAELANSTPTYLKISFDKLKYQHNKYKIISLFKAIKEYELDNIKDVVSSYLQAGNVYQMDLRELLNNLDISLEEVL